MEDFPERDWKYLRGIFPELLEEMSRRINDEVRVVLADPAIGEVDKRGRVYSLVRERDRVVSDCFDDWRHSTALTKCLALKAQGLLKSEHLANLSQDTRRLLRAGEESDDLSSWYI